MATKITLIWYVKLPISSESLTYHSASWVAAKNFKGCDEKLKMGNVCSADGYNNHNLGYKTLCFIPFFKLLLCGCICLCCVCVRLCGGGTK